MFNTFNLSIFIKLDKMISIKLYSKTKIIIYCKFNRYKCDLIKNTLFDYFKIKKR